MAKSVVNKPDWLPANGVEDIYSVSGCISKDFADYINFWKHNGHSLFDSPDVIEQVAREQSIDLTATMMFYYGAPGFSMGRDRARRSGSRSPS